MTVFVSAGEASGDAYGAALVREIRRLAADNPREIFIAELTAKVRAFLPQTGISRSAEDSMRRALTLALALDNPVIGKVAADDFDGDPNHLPHVLGRHYDRHPKAVRIDVIAIGGKKLADVSDHLIADSAKWGAISITQTLKIVPRVLAATPRISRLLGKSIGPSLAIPIDFGFFNVRFARRAKRCGWKLLAFVPPGSWRRERQAAWAPAIYDAVSTPFSWSAEMLKSMGTPNVHWFGHPLKQLLKERLVEAGKIPRLDQIAILPGSRNHELSQNLPLIAASLPSTPGEFALAPGTDVIEFSRRWKTLAPGRHDKFTVGDSAGVLLRSRAALVCSGTATLEAALCRCPMTVIYATSRAMVLESKLIRMKRPRFVALPNILLDRKLVDEFVGEEALPELVQPNLAALLEDGPARHAQLDGFAELDAELGPDDAITQTARLALEMLGVPVTSSST